MKKKNDFEDMFLMLLWLAASLFIFYLVVTLQGCARVVYKDVYVPVKCDIAMPQKPILSGNLVSDYTSALAHSEELEKDLEFCIKGQE